MQVIRFLVNWIVILTAPLWIWLVFWVMIIKDRREESLRKSLKGNDWFWE